MSASTADTLHLATELRIVVTRLVKQLRAHSPTREKLSLTERSVVRLLEQRPLLLAGELAAHEKVSTQAMSQILARLAQRGYLTRQPDPLDRRKVRVALTEAGRAVLQAARQERDEWLHTLLARYPAADLRLLQQALPLLTKLVEAE